MFFVPVYRCRNCKKFYPGAKVEVPNAPLEKLVPAARYTLGSQDHIFKIGGKVIQLADLHQCNDHEVGLANFIKIQMENQKLWKERSKNGIHYSEVVVGNAKTHQLCHH